MGNRILIKQLWGSILIFLHFSLHICQLQIYEILCQAGIPSDQLKLALEPEAATIYVMKEAKTVFGKDNVTTFNPGTKIMVADLGGKFNLITE